MTTTASLALAIEGPIDEQIPDNLGHVLVVVALAAFTVPTGFLAWDTHVRNAVAVERLDGINAELRASRRRLVDVADDAQNLLGDLQGAIEELRDLAHGLYPPLLEASGLPEALALAGRRSGLEVNDDGPGFVVESATGGRGLHNMTDRVAAVDGMLEVRSEPGGGTSVIATIPHGGAYTPIDGG